MIISRLEISLARGTVPDIESVFRRLEIFETAIAVEGCRSLFLCAPEVEGGDVQVIGVWDDHEAYQRWLDHDDRERATPDINALRPADATELTSGELLTVLHTVTADGDLPA